MALYPTAGVSTRRTKGSHHNKKRVETIKIMGGKSMQYSLLIFALLISGLVCNNGSSSDSSDSSDTEVGIYDGLSPEEAAVLQEQRQKKQRAKNQCHYY